MKISLGWLQSYINLPENVEIIGECLTKAGLEVTGIVPFESVQGGLKGLVIGQVVSCEQHPSADKLKKTYVNVGIDRPLSIICGDPTVVVGQKVVVAPVGTIIYNLQGEPFKIKKTKIRGEISEGMLCAEDEIGLSDTHATIITLDTPLVPGTLASTYFECATDKILEIEVTPNRGDACSHLGVARELRVLLDLPLQYPSLYKLPTSSQVLPLHIKEIDHNACPRYSGIVIRDVVVQNSPLWLQNRLKSIGLKPVNNVVDVTNFILHDLGQPLHAFDYDAIVKKEISVKKIEKKQNFITLDQITRELQGEELMICDGAGPLCMAGILGGMRGSIGFQTQNIFLESAYFNPAVIRKSVQKHAIKTDASFRYERGTDPNITVYALKKACILLQKLTNGTIASEIINKYPQKIDYFKVQVTYKNIERLIGYPIAQERIKKILENLEVIIKDESDQGFTAHVPPYRADVTREVDIIEEIIRIHGYDVVPILGELGSVYLANTIQPAPHQLIHGVSTLLAANGYYEICTSSLTKSDYTTLVPIQNSTVTVPVLNPLSNAFNVLRNTLLFSGLEVVAHNIARRVMNMKLFELATVYEKKDKMYQETTQLGIWITGKTMEANWLQQPSEVTFQILNGTVHQILDRLGIKGYSYEGIQHPYYQEGVQVIQGKKILLTGGRVLSTICTYMAIDQPLFFAAINWDLLLKVTQLDKRYLPFSKLPVVKRDLSLVLAHCITFQQVKDVVSQYDNKYIQSIELFDVYTGEKLPPRKKAYAITIKLQRKDRTLDEKTIDKIMKVLIDQFEIKLGAVIRR